MSPKRLIEVLKKLKEGDMTAGIGRENYLRAELVKMTENPPKYDKDVILPEDITLDSRLNALGSPVVSLNRN